MIMSLIYAFAGFGIAIVTHELGHLLYFWVIFKRRPKLSYYNGSICVGTQLDYLGLTKSNKAALYLFGIVAGVIPLLGLGLIIPAGYVVAVFALYFLGCWSDIQNVRNCLLR
jgi:hypothetical protein